MIEEELNEVRNEQTQVWENTKYHLKLAKRNSSIYQMDTTWTVSDSLDTTSEM